MLNATPVHWHCKRHSTVETATFGSEFVAARTPVNQIIDICLTLMYLGVPISPRVTCLETTRQWSQMPLGFHYLQFNWKDGKSNPADILSKHWGLVTIWPLLQPFLFWRGDTSELTTKSKGSDRIPTKHANKLGILVMISYPAHAVKKESQRIVLNFALSRAFPVPKLLKGHIPNFPTYHNTIITSLYSIRGKHLN